MIDDKLNNKSKEKWFEIKHEYNIVDGKRVLKSVTEERKTSEWYNSGIFLWFLGALFLTFIPWAWGGYRSYKEKSDRIEKLDNEMANRLDQLIGLVLRAADSTNRESSAESHKSESIDVKRMLFTFRGIPSETDTPKFYSSYKEFEDNNTVSLLYELRGLESDEKQKESLKNVMILLTTNRLIPFDSIRVKAADSFITVLNDSLYLDRWRK